MGETSGAILLSPDQNNAHFATLLSVLNIYCRFTVLVKSSKSFTFGGSHFALWCPQCRKFQREFLWFLNFSKNKRFPSWMSIASAQKQCCMISQNYGLKGFRQNFEVGSPKILLINPWDPRTPKGLSKGSGAGTPSNWCGLGNALSDTASMLSFLFSQCRSWLTDTLRTGHPRPLPGRGAPHHHPTASLSQTQLQTPPRISQGKGLATPLPLVAIGSIFGIHQEVGTWVNKKCLIFLN